MILFSLFPAFAQEIPTAAVDAQLYRSPVDASDTNWTEDANSTDGFLGRLGVGYMRQPFVWVWQDTGEKVAVVSDALGVDVAASYGLGPVRAGVSIPYYPLASGAQDTSGGFGDLSVLLKAVALDGLQSPIGLGIVGRVTAPTATTDAPLGSDGVTWEVDAVVDRHFGDLLVALNVGERGVPAVALDNIELSNLFLYRLGAGYAIGENAGVSLDVAGQATWGELSNAAGMPIEAMVGGWVNVGDPLTLRLGAGRGLTTGIGAPAARVVLAAEWRPEFAEARPAKPITEKPAAKPPKPVAEKPVEKAVEKPVAAKPVETPAEKPAMTPTVATEPAVVAAVQVVPPHAPNVVTVTRDKLLLPSNVEFDGSRIRESSTLVLNEVAGVLLARPEIAAIRIEGHTDNRGAPDDNLTLSGARAAAVQAYLVGKGLDPDRFIVAGYGGSRPLDKADTDAARARNRRIEFMITEWKEGTTPP